PQNIHEVAGEVDHLNCPTPVPALLQDAAVLEPIAWGVGNFFDTKTPNEQGFAMYINGELFFFIGPLPASGAKWTLRTYTGFIDSKEVTDATGAVTDVTNYAFSPSTR